ncbi:hypothetical protein BN1708_018758, partial [Verticillium longisporum]
RPLHQQGQERHRSQHEDQQGQGLQRRRHWYPGL